MDDQQPHVLIWPFPAQGHIKPMVGLAVLLCHAGLHVTFLNTDHNHRRLTHLQALSTHFPTLHLESISDGLPADHPRTLQFLPELISSIKSVTKPLFRQLLADSTRNSVCPAVTCVIADGIMSFAIDVAKELGIHVIAFRTFSACCLWSYFCLPKLIQEGQLPVNDEDMDLTVAGVPGMEGLLRRRDLPGICRRQPDDPLFQLFVVETQAMIRASALILNTYDDLEGPILSHLAPLFSKIYTIGPLNALLRSRIGDTVSRSLSSFSNLWEVDRSCMTWLDSQPLGSVVYVSFGSLAIMTRGFAMEIWHGLVNSGKRFLWAIRRDTILPGAEGEQVIPVELQEGTKDRGLVVDWAPQEDVLAHPSTGGFLTHSGWNSTLESIVAGVPMVCWPQIADQQINSRWVSEVWRIGLDMKDTCDRSTVETMIKTLMNDGREEIMISMDRIAKLAHDCVSQGGSSYHNLDMLVEDIRKI
ncbi:7-deoxyloganetic acid glucosyltransferase-like isoform X2 [Corylus avellana]|uniref:7-deoxyloganetic acid glucosyltransferase-like isoform X2 n=1 Tax=Corylus avellana TaxID=13451 RepID=UPI00286B618F|nr:7-deoxyloganetic acid glucosyltransferase-like isoform X2 [Corylus avellana]